MVARQVTCPITQTRNAKKFKHELVK